MCGIYQCVGSMILQPSAWVDEMCQSQRKGLTHAQWTHLTDTRWQSVHLLACGSILTLYLGHPDAL